MLNIKEQAVSDAITQKPIKMTVKGKKFTIAPPTLGKMQLLSKLYLQLDIDENALSEQPHIEAMRVAETKTDIICRIMAIATFNTPKELMDDELVAERAEFFKWNCGTGDFSTCLLTILTQVNYSNFMTSIRLTEMLRQNKPNSMGAVRVE